MGPFEKEADMSVPESGGSSRGRGIAAVVCVVLAALLLTPAAVAYWGQRTLNDTERYVATVGPLVESPEVQDVIATRVTDALEAQVDTEALVHRAFAGVIDKRPRLEQLVGPLSAAINGLIEREVRSFIASDEFADFWARANTRAQEALHRVLTGDGSGAISVQDDQIVLDVDEVIAQVKEHLVARGLTIVNNVPIPETDRQIVLVDSPELKQLRTIYAFGNPIARWMLPVVGLLLLGALVLARNRPRMAVVIGAVLAANALLIALMLSIGEQLFVNQLSGTAFGPASRIFFDTLLTYLRRGQQVVLWLGLVIIVAGWFAGRNRYGTAVRTSLTGGLEGVGARLPDSQVGGVATWVATNLAWLRAVVIALGGVVLLWGNQATTSRLWWSVALTLLLLVVLQVLAGGRREARLEPRAATSTPSEADPE
jgi:hypothetical protein